MCCNVRCLIINITIGEPIQSICALNNTNNIIIGCKNCSCIEGNCPISVPTIISPTIISPVAQNEIALEIIIIIIVLSVFVLCLIIAFGTGITGFIGRDTFEIVG